MAQKNVWFLEYFLIIYFPELCFFGVEHAVEYFFKRSKKLQMRNFLGVAVFFLTIAIVFVLFDFMLAKRAKEIISEVESRKNTEKTIVFNDQPADICSALTEKTWLKTANVFTNNLKIPKGCNVSVTGGYCGKSKKHQIVFECSK